MLFGRVMHEAAAGFEEISFMILELMKNGLLMGRTLHPPKDETASKAGDNITPSVRHDLANIETANPENTHAIVLLSRIFSLLPCNTDPEAWDGMLDYDLC
mmetsp:Transcript_25269/g.12006  ORF Transcript_25269/g.12006 Transcript_25269/m.12006 type:complete len:101 (+) Transcript_25269:93-395(+)